uniref:Uncharacterized protein n=1 Tax=Zonotrichia albicollis TaxID=44394 RepID=A0A8D2QDU3_ZONAL
MDDPQCFTEVNGTKGCSKCSQNPPKIPLFPPTLQGSNRDRKASRWFGVSQSKSAKTSVNILQQEELIAQKKREIEARLEQQARQNSLSIPQLPLLGEYVGIRAGNLPLRWEICPAQQQAEPCLQIRKFLILGAFFQGIPSEFSGKILGILRLKFWSSGT